MLDLEKLRNKIIYDINSSMIDMLIEDPYNDEELFWNDAIKQSRICAVNHIFETINEFLEYSKKQTKNLNNLTNVKSFKSGNKKVLKTKILTKDMKEKLKSKSKSKKKIDDLIDKIRRKKKN